MPSKIEQEVVDKGDAIKIETGGEIVEEPDANLKKRKIVEPEINPGGASSLTADTPKWRESEQGSSSNESSLAGCIAAVNNLLCDVPTVDLSRDRTAQSGKFPEDELKAGRELELRNMLNLYAFESVDDLPPRKHAYEMVWVDVWRGNRVRSRLCVRQFKAEGLRDNLFAGTPDTFFIKYLLEKAASCKDFGILVVDISAAFMHARTDEEGYVKVPSGIKSSQCWRLKAGVNGTRKASKHWQEYSSDKLVTNMPFQQNDINPCIDNFFCNDLDLEGDGFLVCGVTRSLEKWTEEFNRHFVVKKSEIVSLKPEHQSETHFLKRRISVDEFGWHVELDQRYVKSLLDTMAMNHCKSMATPESKGQEGNNATKKLDAKEHREFRSVAGICQYMTEQRFDIAFSTKEIMREAAGPTTASKTKLKRIARYLKGRQRCVLRLALRLERSWVATAKKG